MMFCGDASPLAFRAKAWDFPSHGAPRRGALRNPAYGVLPSRFVGFNPIQPPPTIVTFSQDDFWQRVAAGKPVATDESQMFGRIIWKPREISPCCAGWEIHPNPNRVAIMKAPLDVLLLEDSITDAFSIYHVLRRAGILISPHRAASKAEFVQELSRHQPDVILAADTIQSFDGLAALTVAQATRPDTPFVLVSKALHDPNAVTALIQGAAACVTKRDLTQLPPTVEQVVRAAEARDRRQRRGAMFQKILGWFRRTPTTPTPIHEQQPE